MLITQQYLAFSGWPDTRVLLSLQQIATVEKQSIFFVPNAILVTTLVGEDYFFGSFLDRDLCYNILTCTSNIAKSLVQMELVPGVSPVPSDHSNTSLEVDGIALHDPPLGHRDVELAADIALPYNNTIGVSRYDVDIPALFKKNDVVTLLDRQLPKHRLTDVWHVCWATSVFYRWAIIRIINDIHGPRLSTLSYCSVSRSFLAEQGDLHIQSTEWTPLDRAVEEDVCNIPFLCSRTMKFEHPRTTMLMIGPKNAPASQSQYLYMYQSKSYEEGGDPVRNKDTKFCPEKLIVLTVTQFDGIPLSGN